ncbi:hypothetical protein H0H92_007143 [Tricholoma furcatifolium]|nr:hypothetical protein H0H92_007143 [Tricholoma furcatifolium]
MANDIQQLSDLISSSVTALLQACNENNTPFPGPNEPFTPESEAFRSSKVVVDATNVIAAAAMQLAQRVLPPYMPEEKHDGTSGYVALLEHLVGDGAKFSCHLLENLRDPKTGYSNEVMHAPFNRAIGMDITLWDWYNLLEETYRRHRFAIAMRGIARMQKPDILADSIDWKTLPEGALVVDVGGGIGTSAVSIAKYFKHIKFIVQDLPSVCTEGVAYWNEQDPDIINSGRLQFMPHDFFETQPVKDASVFLLTQILHDWSDANCDRILKALRAAAMSDTKLILLDNLVAHVCRDSSVTFEYNEAPLPLLPNFGAANVFPYVLDLLMMVYLNSQERTLRKLDDLLRRNGWKIVDVRRQDPPSNFYEPIVAVPV